VGMEGKLHVLLTSRFEMEMSGQIDTATVLPSEKEPSVSSGQGAWWTCL
jgi:hypothetical protein